MMHCSPKRGRAAPLTASLMEIIKKLPNISAVTYAYITIRSCLASGLLSSDQKVR